MHVRFLKGLGILSRFMSLASSLKRKMGRMVKMGVRRLEAEVKGLMAEVKNETGGQVPVSDKMEYVISS